MFKFVFKAIVFFVLSVFMILAYKNYSLKKLNQRFGVSLKERIEDSFLNATVNDYNLLIVGNSRPYRGIDPDFLDIPSYNFSNDNDSYNVIYYKMLFLDDSDVEYDHVILGVDYFMFSFLDGSRNYIYVNHLDKMFLKDYKSGNKLFLKDYKSINKIQFFLDDLENYRGIRKTEIIIETIDTINKNPELTSFAGLTYKKNGHLLDTWHAAKESDKVERVSNRLIVQENYFNRIIEKCKKEDKKLYLVMPPVRSNELQQYPKNVISEYDSFFNSKTTDGVYYFNYSTDTSFSIADFSDITHLNGFGSEKLTKKINRDIIQLSH